jgi:hypothetical protein
MVLGQHGYETVVKGKRFGVRGGTIMDRWN